MTEDDTYRSLMVGGLKTRYDFLIKKMHYDIENMSANEHQELIEISGRLLEFKKRMVNSIAKESL